MKGLFGDEGIWGMTTYRWLVAALALAGVAGAQPRAFSADLPPGTLVTKAPTATIAYRWTGCYLGANVGAASGRAAFFDATPPNPTGLDHGVAHATGALGGGQIGCDYQAGNWVFGLQGMVEAANLNGTSHFVPGPADPQSPNILDMRSRVSSLATATARLGYAVQPQILIYAKGGGAWMRSSIDYMITGMGLTFPFAGSETRTGWTVGGGAEFLIAPNWSVFAEYNYIDFGSKTPTLQGNGITAGATVPIQINHRIDTAMFGVNYRFGSP
jgi:outer membrane immunogenic protein